jgi:hypothetical protein
MENSSSSDNEQQYFKGRGLRIPGWKNLYKDVLQLHSTLVILFLVWFYEDLVLYLEEPKSKLPGKQNRLGVQLGLFRILLLGGLWNVISDLDEKL